MPKQDLIHELAIARNNCTQMRDHEWASALWLLIPELIYDVIKEILYVAKCLRYAVYGWKQPERN